ncbi:MAG TPA: hypothetical protein VFQ16_12280 [Burkholderiaceae bacterium]|nr:hypothetical protein [Burkholderiaceae bacterium]
MQNVMTLRQRAAAAVLALVLAAAAPASTAATLSLDALLRLSIEQLLQVRVHAGGSHAR